MGVYIKCPQCGEELNHDDEAYHLSKEGGDSNVLSCRKCEWVGVVRLEVEFKDTDKGVAMRGYYMPKGGFKLSQDSELVRHREARQRLCDFVTSLPDSVAHQYLDDLEKRINQVLGGRKC